MPKNDLKRSHLRKTLPFLGVTLPAIVLAASYAFAQGSLLPAPGTPATPPAAPATQGGGDNAARARATALAAKANIDITEAWTRASGNATSAPLYFHIVSAKDADRLLSVEVHTADKVEIKDAMGRAGPVQAVDIPAGGTVNFAPNGQYINLVGLKAPLKEGDSFLLTLKFDKAGTSSAAVKILGTGANGYTAQASVRRGDTTAGVTQR